MALRWGIAGLGKVSHDFVVSLSPSVLGKEHEIVAVASRDLKRSEIFASLHRINNFYGSYEELGKNDEIDIVYIAVLNPYHYDICKLMISYGKNILCEKPFCMNYFQVKTIISLAKSKNLFVMEGIWSRFFPVYTHLRNLIDNGTLGQVREVYVKHGFKGLEKERIISKEKGGGVLLDIGVYAIQFVLFCYGEKPKKIKATGKTNKDGVDLYFEAEFEFSLGRKANIICSAIEAYENQAVVISTKGTICIPMYWCPTTLIEPDCAIKMWELPEGPTTLNYVNSMGLRYEADEVFNCIKKGKKFSEMVSYEDMESISQIEDEIRKQIGVSYECDSIFNN